MTHTQSKFSVFVLFTVATISCVVAVTFARALLRDRAMLAQARESMAVMYLDLCAEQNRTQRAGDLARAYKAALEQQEARADKAETELGRVLNLSEVRR